MSPSPPTGREVLILIILLISLVFLSNSNKPSAHIFSRPLDAILNTSHIVTPWQSTTVSETTVVTHAPGQYIFVLYFLITYTIQDGPFLTDYTFSKASFL